MPDTARLLRTRAARLFVSERVVLSVIVLNAIALFVLASVEEGSLAARVAFATDFACVVFFLLEAALKLQAKGVRAYLASGLHRADLAVVLLSTPVLLTPWVDLHEFGVVLVLRLGRLFRLFRLLRFIPDRERLVGGIKRSLRASVGILLGLLLLNLILALGASFLFGRLAPEHFGNPALSLYSLFRVFTIEGWYELPDLLAARADNVVWGILARLYFTGSVLAGGILGLSLANAVFVDEMIMDNNDELEAKVDALQADLSEIKALLLARAAAEEAPATPRIASGGATE